MYQPYKVNFRFIPVIFQVASLLAALTHPGHRVLRAGSHIFYMVIVDKNNPLLAQ